MESSKQPYVRLAESEQMERFSAKKGEQIELTISCRNLKNFDTLSLTDPQCKISEWNLATDQWKLIGETEVIDDNLNPDFVKTIKFPYYFQKTQNLKFEVFDFDPPDKLEFIGAI